MIAVYCDFLNVYLWQLAVNKTFIRNTAEISRVQILHTIGSDDHSNYRPILTISTLSGDS